MGRIAGEEEIEQGLVELQARRVAGRGDIVDAADVHRADRKSDILRAEMRAAVDRGRPVGREGQGIAGEQGCPGLDRDRTGSGRARIVDLAVRQRQRRGLSRAVAESVRRCVALADRAERGARTDVDIAGEEGTGAQDDLRRLDRHARPDIDVVAVEAQADRMKQRQRGLRQRGAGETVRRCVAIDFQIAGAGDLGRAVAAPGAAFLHQRARKGECRAGGWRREALEQDREGFGVGRGLDGGAAQGAVRDRAGIGDDEIAIGLLVILREAAHRLPRGDEQRDRQRALLAGMRDARIAGRGVGAVADRADATAQWRGGLADLDAVGAGQDRIIGRQQGVRAGGQARHACRNRDLLADHRIAGALFGTGRRIARGIAGDDRIDLVGGGTSRRRRIGIDERRLEHVDRTATTRDESRAGNGGAARRVDHRACGDIDRGAIQRETGILDRRIHRRAVIAVIHAVRRAAIGNDEAGARNRRDTARQQVDLLREDAGRTVEAGPIAAERDRPQRRADDAALVDDAGVQRDLAECR